MVKPKKKINQKPDKTKAWAKHLENQIPGENKLPAKVQLAEQNKSNKEKIKDLLTKKTIETKVTKT
nr:hypothetical protein [Mycoplasmopsis bovis]